MAVLSKHGAEIGRIEKLTSIVAYMADGKILRNQGDGWKQYRKVKPGINPQDAFNRSLEAATQFKAERPCYVEYKKQLHALACNGKRCLVHMTVETLGNDHDGVWSELNDMIGISCSFDEVADLCRAYDAMIAEQDRINASKPANA